MASPGRSANENRLELPRHGPEAEISPVKPTCHISSWHFATINAPYRTFPSEQVPPAIARTSSRFRAARLTAPPVLASTTVSRGPSRPCSIAEQKASQSLPALEALVSNRQCRHPRGGGPEVFLVVHVPGFSCDPSQGAPEAYQGQQSTRPAPDAVPLFPPSFEHAFNAARGSVCPLGLPACLRSQARHRPGLSVRGEPIRVDGATAPVPIQQMA